MQVVYEAKGVSHLVYSCLLLCANADLFGIGFRTYGVEPSYLNHLCISRCFAVALIALFTFWYSAHANLC